MIFVISGPSASGKTTLVKHVRAVMPDVKFSISCTTRPERPGHGHDSSDYQFITEGQFDRRIKEGCFAEWAVVHGFRYGTPWSQIKQASSAASGDTDVILDVDVKGARSIKRRFPEAVLVFVVPPSLTALEARLRKRNTEDEKSMERRFASLKEEISVIDQYDYVIINNSLSDARREIERAIAMFKTRKIRIEHIKAAYS